MIGLSCTNSPNAYLVPQHLLENACSEFNEVQTVYKGTITCMSSAALRCLCYEPHVHAPTGTVYNTSSRMHKGVNIRDTCSTHMCMLAFIHSQIFIFVSWNTVCYVESWISTCTIFHQLSTSPTCLMSVPDWARVLDILISIIMEAQVLQTVFRALFF